MTVAANVKLAKEIIVEIEYQKDFNLDGLIETVKFLDEEDLDEIAALTEQCQEFATAFNEILDALKAAADFADDDVC
jgi:hypothetical protein